MNNEIEYLSRLYKDIESAVKAIKTDPIQENLDSLQNNLNKLFNDSKCLRVIYTPNVDKMFFGVYAFPKISGDEVIDILFKDTKFLVKEYWLELDSKLFNSMIMLTSEEVTALIVHDVAHLVNNSSPASMVKREIDNYLVKNNEVLKVSNAVQYRGMLAYGFADAMRKYTTIFEQDIVESDDITDEFLNQIMNFNGMINNAFYKISQTWGNYNREVRNKFITMSWILRLYKDVRHNRIPGLEGIKRCIELSPSQIEQRELKNLGKRFSRIDDDMLLESNSLALKDERVQSNKILNSLRENAILNKPRHMYSSKSIIESMQDDLDYMALGTQSDDIDGMNDLLGNMNKKMAMIQDYVTSDKDITIGEYNQWEAMFKECDRTRKDLSNGLLYNEGRRMINSYQRSIDQ